MGMEDFDLPAPLAEALLASEFPLADIYKDFRDMETGHMDNIQESIKGRAEGLLEAQREAAPIIPLYQHTGEYAREHGELDAFRASRQANVDCKEGIEAAIRAGYDGMHLRADVKGVLAKFGPERVTYVLAATIQRKDWDERFSRDNKTWAAAVPMFEQDHRRSPYIVHIHSTVVNGFINMARKEMDTMREQRSQKLSIKAQLAAKPVSGDTPAEKPKDREVR